MDNSFDGNETYIENFNSFLTSSRELIDSNEISFKDMVHKSKENDLLTLIYTEQRAPLKVLCYLTKILYQILFLSLN